jgi:hypothetical protein
MLRNELPTAPSSMSRSMNVAPATLAANVQDAPKEATLDELGSMQRMVRFGLSLRNQWVPTSGYDRFAKTDHLVSWTFEGNATIWTRGRWSFAAGGLVDLGTSSATTRGQSSALGAHRFLLALDGRYHLTPGLFVFARLAPGVMVSKASLREDSAPLAQNLTSTGVHGAADVSVGASLFLNAPGSPQRRPLRAWASAELGYGATTSRELDLTPNDVDALAGRQGTTRFGSLAIAGAYFRLGVTLSL